MKSKIVLVTGVLALATLVGCNGSNSPSASSGEAPREVASAPAERADYVLGTPASNWDVMSRAYTVDGSAMDRTDESTFAGFPLLASRVSEAAISNHVVATVEHTLELYDKDTLVMILATPEGAAPSVSWSRSGFLADQIAVNFNMADDKKGTSSGSIKFDLSECNDQDQGQGKPDEGQGKKPILGAGTAPDQGQGKPEAPKERICKLATVELILQGVSAPDQGQGKPDEGQGKAPDQDQGKPDEGQGKPDEGQGGQGGQG